MEAVLVLDDPTRKRNLYFFASQAMTRIGSGIYSLLRALNNLSDGNTPLT